MTAQKQMPKRTFRLSTQWCERSTDLTTILLAKLLTKEQLTSRALPTFVVQMEIEFNYNFESFAPKPTCWPPKLIPLEELSVGREEREELARFHRSNNGKYIYHLVTVNLGEEKLKVKAVSIYNTDYAIQQANKYSWDELREHFLRIPLESSIFAKFWLLKEENFKVQTEGLMKLHQMKLLIVSALNLMDPLSSKHRTHVLVVKFEFGNGLCEIRRLVDYEAMHAKELMDDVEQSSEFWKNRMPKDRLVFLNLSPQSPVLADKPAGAIYTPVIFWGSISSHKYKCLNITPFFFTKEVLEAMNVLRMLQSAELDAEANFRHLQSVPLPPVTSPPIN